MVGNFLLQIFRKNNYLCIVMWRTSESLTNRIAKIPMAMVIIPFALGIFSINAYVVPLWILLTACAISVVGAIVLDGWWRIAAIGVMIFSVGATLHSIPYREELPYNKAVNMVLNIETTSVCRGSYTSAEAEISECEEPIFDGCRVVVWGDSLVKLSAGDRLHLTTPIRPFRAEREGYAKLMHTRGFVGSVSVKHTSTYEFIPTEKPTLHDWAVNRLRSTMDEGDARAVVLAMTTGERGEIGTPLRNDYSASGASHLLAVSGLHIGIAFMLINLLLLPLVLLRYGNLVRSILAIVLIWIYVWMCGLSPSAVRAAIMFSLLQFSLSSVREYVSINILASTAFIMLMMDTRLLFDISFQLSFVAVAGIILWAMPLYRICTTRSKALNSLIGVLLVGVASTIATIPIVATTFSVVAVVGILINPIVIVLANIIVLSGVLALALPFMSAVAEVAAEWQNAIVRWAASLPYGHFEVTMSEWAMWGIYALYGLVTIALFSIPKQKKGARIE